MVVFRAPMPVALALVLELMVGLMLIGLGARALWRRQPMDRTASKMRPLAVGVVHGLAGSAVLALLILTTTESAWGAAVYLVCFCVGTIVAMSVVSALFTIPSRLDAARSLVMHRAVCVVAAVVSMGIGASIAHRVSVDTGILTTLTSGR